MSEHTKEPWKVFDANGVLEIQDNNGDAIVFWTGFDAGDKSKHEKKATARRIVACVNACQRLNTDLLERVTKNGGFGLHPRPQERIEELESERNDYKARALMYEAANAEQGKLLNEVIAERDELRKDAERLNYLIAEECQVWEVNGRYSVCDVTERTAAAKEYPSAREAIDAAIAKCKP